MKPTLCFPRFTQLIISECNNVRYLKIMLRALILYSLSFFFFFAKGIKSAVSLLFILIHDDHLQKRNHENFFSKT